MASSEPGSRGLRGELAEVGTAIVQLAMGVGVFVATMAIVFASMLAVVAVAEGFHIAVGWLR